MICLYEIHPYNKIKHVAIKIMYGPSIKFQTSVQERKGKFRYTENNNENVQTCAYAVFFYLFYLLKLKIQLNCSSVWIFFDIVLQLKLK